MAKKNKISTQVSRTSNSKESADQKGNSENKGKKNGFLFGFFAFLTALAIMAVILGGAFYFAISKNIGGLTDKYKSQISTIPILKLAIPKVYDPNSSKNLTEAQVKHKYEELRKTSSELQDKLSAAEKKIAELQKYKDSSDTMKAENEKALSDLGQQKALLEEKKKQLEEEKKGVDEIVARADTEAFKAYFEQVDKETAKKIYTEIINGVKADKDARKLSQYYENMDPSQAAKILEQLGTKGLGLTVEIIRNASSEASSQILAAMNPAYASKITQKLATVLLSQK